MRLKSALLWVLLLMSTILQAQSSMGTDFWVSFLPNGTPNTSYDYYLSITLASKEASVVKLENEELGYSETVTLTANSVKVVRVPYDDFNAQEFGEILNKTVHVTSSTPISVYAENFCWYSNDATLVLPVSACGSYYIVQSHIGRTKSQVGVDHTPSTLSVIAFEDGTKVQITPSQTTTTGQEANVTYTITLNKGQVYQLATKEINNGRGLSGTKIQALGDKKVSVYSGNICCTVPDATSPGDSDMLFDVDYPVSSWGKKFIVQPFKGDNYDMVRVTACKDGTAIYKNGTLLATIDALDSYEFIIAESDGAFSVETSEPVALYQYMTGNAYLTSRSMGGPSFQYVPPVEQAVKEATFTTTTNSMVEYHYVNLVVKTTDVATITLDGKTGFATFTEVDDVYSSASVRMSAGIHTLASQSGFIGNVYGVGTNVSYSYALGSEIAAINPNEGEYTVVYDGNGSTSGSMQNDLFTIGTAETTTLSANTYERKYTVSFENNGGSEVDPMVCNYTFNGWLHDTLLTEVTNNMEANWNNISTSMSNTTDLKLITLSTNEGVNTVSLKQLPVSVYIQNQSTCQ